MLLRCSADSNARAAHAAEAHPYKPFPVTELEAAVAQVPLSNFEEAERVLTQFDSPYFIRSAVHNLLKWLLLLAWPLSQLATNFGAASDCI